MLAKINKNCRVFKRKITKGNITYFLNKKVRSLFLSKLINLILKHKTLIKMFAVVFIYLR